MPTRYLSEKSALAPKNADGSYPLLVIDEGRGSSGVYSRELLEKSAHVFENVPSFANHPINPDAPHERDLNTIAGRIVNVRAEERDGKMALVGDFKARKEYVPIIEEFGDIIGASIFCAASGEVDDSGRIVVESFSASDPYRSVDLVVAAGRGGRFERAAESLRLIESSLGLPAEPKEKEENLMELKELSEQITKLAEALQPVVLFVTEESARRQAEANANAEKKDIGEAVDAAVAAVEAIKAENLLPSLEKSLIESAKRGDDVAAALEMAKTITAEGTARTTEGAAPRVAVHEAYVPGDKHDYTIVQLLSGVN